MIRPTSISCLAIKGRDGYWAKKLGIKVQRNWLRHGFGNYRVAITQNSAQVEEEVGNSHFAFHRHCFSAQNQHLTKECFSLPPPTDRETRWQEILMERRVIHLERQKNYWEFHVKHPSFAGDRQCRHPAS